MDQWDSYMGKKWHQLPSLTPLLQNMDKPTNGYNKIYFYLEWSCVTVKSVVEYTGGNYDYKWRNDSDLSPFKNNDWKLRNYRVTSLLL